MPASNRLLGVGETTLGSLARREALLLSCLGLAAAIGALGKFAGSPALELVAIIVAIAGAALRIRIAVRRSKFEGRVEEAARSRLTRVPIGPIEEVDPTQAGVDAAPPQGILAGGSVPDYVPREVDAELKAAIDAAVAGQGAWIVVAVGPSKVGKSRALFEALTRSSAQGPLDFVAPVDAAAVLALSSPGELPEDRDGRNVLWLDDLEPFINQGMSLKSLREWRERHPGSIVAGTYGGKGSEILREAGTSGLATVADEILQQSEEVLVSGTSSSELEPLKEKVSESVLRSIEQHGLAAYLVAGPKLQRKLGTGIHAPGEPACPEGVAIVYATADWARCGRTDAIPDETLRQLWEDYLPSGVRSTDEAFERGLDWALRPVAGTIALIEHTNSYRAYDYVVRIVEGAPGAEPPTESAWRAVMAGASDAQAVGVGIMAFQRDAYRHAAEAFELGRESSDTFYRAIAGVNLAVTLRELGEHVEALAAFEYMARFEDSESAVMREGAIYSLIEKGTTLVLLDRREEALAAFADVASRYADAEEPSSRTQVARAIFNKALTLGELDRPEDSLAACDELLAVSGADQDPEVGMVVAEGLYNKGVTLIGMKRFDAAVEVFDDSIVRAGAIGTARMRRLIAKALFNRATCLGALGRGSEAIVALDELASAFRDSPEPGLREKTAEALMMKGLYLGKEGREEEKLDAYGQVVAWFGEDRDPRLREAAAASLLGMGEGLIDRDRFDEAIAVLTEAVDRLEDEKETVLEKLLAEALRSLAEALGRGERHEEELAVYDRLIVRFAGTNEPEAIPYTVAVAMFNQGTRRWMLGDHDAAIETFDRLVARFGDAISPAQQVVVARALINRGGVLLKESSGREALASFEEVVTRFGEVPDLSLREEVARAKLAQAIAHSQLDEGERALAVLDELLTWIGDAQEEPLRAAAAEARRLRDDFAD